ncbi:MAG: TonB family protein [Deltaproteobacteria bacterium]|nr:TonB family protein [Deltaproteobacteria bacterium]
MGNYYTWGYQPRFGPMVALSVVFHMMVLSFTLLYSKGISQRVFIAPFYTVELVGPLPERPGQAEIKPVEKKAEVVKPKVEIKPADKKPLALKPKEKVIPMKKVKDTSPKEEVASIEGTLSRIRERVKEREEEEMIQRKVRELEDRRIAMRIEELKKKVMAEEAVSRPIRIEAPQLPPSPTQGKITKELLELEFKAYYLALREKVYAAWAYLGPIGDLEAIISIRIGRDGGLVDRWIEKASGNPAYDQSAMRAVEKAAPFPPLPDGLGDTLEIGIRFCQVCSGIEK